MNSYRSSARKPLRGGPRPGPAKDPRAHPPPGQKTPPSRWESQPSVAIHARRALDLLERRDEHALHRANHDAHPRAGTGHGAACFVSVFPTNRRATTRGVGTGHVRRTSTSRRSIRTRTIFARLSQLTALLIRRSPRKSGDRHEKFFPPRTAPAPFARVAADVRPHR